jgi:hypothetical protein
MAMHPWGMGRYDDLALEVPLLFLHPGKIKRGSAVYNLGLLFASQDDIDRARAMC